MHETHKKLSTSSVNDLSKCFFERNAGLMLTLITETLGGIFGMEIVRVAVIVKLSLTLSVCLI